MRTSSVSKSSNRDFAGDFAPTAGRDVLELRVRLLRRVRQFFDERGYLEVDTPLLSANVAVDRHLDPFATILATDPRHASAGRTLWLQTSPEFAMKRLLACGTGAIYQITRAFRNGEIGPKHNPEFTIVEWYQPHADMADGVQTLSELCEALLELTPAELISYREAFLRYVGLDPFLAATPELIAVAQRAGISAETLSHDDRDGWLDLLLVERIEPQLGQSAPTILYDYPASQAALARIRDEDPPLAERFELYVRGIELANGYHELCDPDELCRRIDHANHLRIGDGKPPLPRENRLLAAMQSGLPPSTGVALGFDRVVMLAAGAKTIADVIPFPIDRA